NQWGRLPPRWGRLHNADEAHWPPANVLVAARPRAALLFDSFGDSVTRMASVYVATCRLGPEQACPPALSGGVLGEHWQSLGTAAREMANRPQILSSHVRCPFLA